jgi:hypothetical protein
VICTPFRPVLTLAWQRTGGSAIERSRYRDILHPGQQLAQAGSVQVAGSAGYASEWTLAGEVIQKGGAQQYAGPVTFTHAGLCTVSGPPVKSSEIRFEISGSGSSSKIQATILYEGTWCEYNGKLSGLSSHGFMRCSGTDQIPITLTIK